jgi:hypothetical protein
MVNKIKLRIAPGDTNKVDITPKTFTAGETNLTLIGKNTAGIATIEAVLTSDESQVVARLKVHVFEERTVSVGFYRITDPDSADTAPVGGANADAILATMNEVFKQCGVKLTKAVENNEVERQFDTTPKDGKFQLAEESALTPATLNQGQLRVFLVKESGITYDEDSPHLVRAYANPPLKWAIAFTINCGDHLALIVAHEIGHLLMISTQNSDGNDHDQGPYPDQNTPSLMRKGTDDQGNPLASPGRWLRQQDWKKANTSAGGL